MIRYRAATLCSIAIQGNKGPLEKNIVDFRWGILGLVALRTAAIYGDRKRMKFCIFVIWIVS